MKRIIMKCGAWSPDECPDSWLEGSCEECVFAETVEMERITIYIQLDYEKTQILENGYCEKCLAPARHWIEPDRFGNFDVFPAADHAGNVCGFLCPGCAKIRDKE